MIILLISQVRKLFESRIIGDVVVDILNNISYHRGLPERIRMGNRPDLFQKHFTTGVI